MRKIFVLFVTGLLCTFVTAQTNSSGKGMLELQALNTLSVTVGGNFIIEGSFATSGLERLDQFITRLYEQVKSEKMALANKNPDRQPFNPKELEYAKRNITLKHANGSSEVIDLEKFRRTGDLKFNPYLRLDDLILFPKLDLEKDFFSIVGAVKSTGKFQFNDGDRLSDALLFAGGFDPAYDTINAISISRLSANGEREDLLIFRPDENPPLKRGDRIVVKARETNRRDFRVNIQGEVAAPGIYPISKNSTTISEIIKKAGGFTSQADLLRAELLRGTNVFQSTFFSEDFENLMMNRMADITKEDSLTFYIDNKLRFSRGNGIVDFTKINNDTTLASRFILQDGDFIFIPRQQKLVYVFGHVFNPGYVNFAENMGVDFYIQKAGGIGENSKEEIYIIKGRTRSWIKYDPKHPAQIEAGDFIWIPKQQPRSFDYYLTRITAISGIVSALATTILLVVQLRK